MPKELDIPPDTHINYNDAVGYWSSVPATVDGVLGGFGATQIPKVDVSGSHAFINRLLNSNSRFSSVPEDQRLGLDVGAGIGRVTLNVLSKACSKVDLLEPVQQFVDQAHQDLADLKAKGKIGELYCVGMQDFVPEAAKYWLIWCQWCVGHLSDDNLVKFWERCIAGLQPNGIIVVKENNCYMEDEFDDTDSSVTRTDEKFKQLFERAGLQLLFHVKQAGMPKNVYPVTMYALIPKARLG